MTYYSGSELHSGHYGEFTGDINLLLVDRDLTTQKISDNDIPRGPEYMALNRHACIWFLQPDALVAVPVALFSSALAFAPVRFKSCSCLYSSRCLRTHAHTSTSPAALTARPEIASILSHSLGFKSCLYSSRPRPRSFASSWTLQHFSPALHPQRSPRCPQCPISIS